MACAEDPALRAAVPRRELHGARRPAARLGAQRARPPAPRPRLRPRPHVEGVRARGRGPATRMYLHGGRNEPEALAGLARKLRLAPPRPADRRRLDAALRRVLRRGARRASRPRSTRKRPDVVWVGLGVPRQEKWMQRMRPRLEAPVLVGVGAAFDFHAGLVPAGARLDAALRAGVALPPRPRAAPALAALSALQPPLRDRLRPAVRAATSARAAASLSRPWIRPSGRAAASGSPATRASRAPGSRSGCRRSAPRCTASATTSRRSSRRPASRTGSPATSAATSAPAASCAPPWSARGPTSSSTSPPRPSCARASSGPWRRSR